MELSTSTISNEIDKSIKEEFSVSQAAIDEIRRRRERGQKPESISNEEIKKGDPILDTYQVLDDAMHGGMGSVWRVHHESWNVDLAMKRPQPRFFAEGSEARKEEFIRECENWINLGLHPNIVSCYYVREIVTRGSAGRATPMNNCFSRPWTVTWKTPGSRMVPSGSV